MLGCRWLRLCGSHCNKKIQHKTRPEFWPSPRQIFKTSLYYKTHLILRDLTVFFNGFTKIATKASKCANCWSNNADVNISSTTELHRFHQWVWWICALHIGQEISLNTFHFMFAVEVSVMGPPGHSLWPPLDVDSDKLTSNWNWTLMCEIRMTMLHLVAQKHVCTFCAPTETLIMLPVMNARVKKFAHCHHMWLLSVIWAATSKQVTKILGSKKWAWVSDFREFAACEI